MTDQSHLLSPRRLRVFLCHSSDDKRVVRDLYHRLKACNVDPWLDEIDILAGQDFWQEIRKAVRATDVVIVCLSQGSTSKTGFVQKEIKFALDVADEQPEGTIFLIPLKLEECELPERLKPLQAVNYLEEDSFDKLMRSLKSKSVSLRFNLAPIDCQPGSEIIKFPPSKGTTLYVYSGHSASVDSVVWSPDGSYIASGSADKTVQIWNASSRKTIYTYRGHSNRVLAVAWSPDSKHLASGGNDGIARVWDLWNITKLSIISTYPYHSSVVSDVAWSPDGKRIASSSWDKTVQVWDALTGKNAIAYREHSSIVNAVTWSPDGYYIASANNDGDVRVWQCL